MKRWLMTALVGFAAAGFAPAADADARALIATIKAVKPEGDGNVEAAKAWQRLTQAGPAAIYDILPALDDANPLAANWLRSAVDALAESSAASGKPLDAAKLEAFVRDTRHNGAARRLAFELLTRVDAAAPERLLPTMLNDPGSELRRDAIARALDEAKKVVEKDRDTGKAAYKKVLSSARDKDQVDLIAKELKTLGEPVDLPSHFNFITKWHLIGPFDNVNKKGFDVAYPPEKGVDLKASYEGKEGAKVRWTEHATADPYAMVDLNKAIGKNMGAVGYGFAAVESPEERAVEIRAGSNNAVKVFLNGKPIYFRHEYHHGMKMDQHVGRGVLKKGRNDILIKVCQNEQTDAWAQNWSFQLRICDDIGGPVPVKLLADKSAVPSQGGEE